jgi:hypothetical protein
MAHVPTAELRGDDVLVRRGTMTLRVLVSEGRALRDVLNRALAEHARRNPPPLGEDVAGYTIGRRERRRT